MSIWLNIQAVKLQYDGFRSKKMLKAITAALDIARDEERHISYSTEVKVNGQQQQQILPEVQKMSGKSIVIPSSNGSKHQPSNLDFARIVNELEAEKLDAPSSHDTVVMLNVTLWLVVISIVGFASVFSDKTKELIVGITVNLNLVVFYASPLTVIFKVLGSRSSASIHIPTMIGITLCGSFWAAYGVTVLDAFLAVPNALGALLGFIQIFLCLVFPRNTKNSSSPDEAPETVLDVTGKSVLVSSTDEEAVGGSIRQPRC